jgi:K+-sensing histidine kinase KdpD
MAPPVISEERRRHLRRADDRQFRAILDADADGVVVVDHEGVICYANPAAATMLGRPSDVLVGELFGYPLVAGATAELNLVRAADAEAIVEMRVVATEWDGEPALLASLRDVTDRRRLEAERAARLRAEAERAAADAALQARDAFLALAAHELKTPLTRIALFVQDVLRRLPRQERGANGDTARDALLLVDRETAHLARLVNHMLDLARIEDGTFVLDRKPTDLRELVDRVVARVRSSTDNAELSATLPDRPLVVPVDAGAVGAVVTSLVAGAVRQSAEPAAIDVRLNRERTGARLVVQDGAGALPADARAALSDPTLSVVDAAAVTSLGVAVHVTRRIVEMHGGDVVVDFPDDRGTRVTITLPA